MDFVPLDPTDDNVAAFLDSVGSFPFSFVAINNPGDYENENIVFRAEEDIDSLYGFILFYSVEDTETGLPDYAKTRLLTFDDIELQKGSHLQIYTSRGEDSSSIEFETAALHQAVYWGLPASIWDVPHATYEIMKRSDSIQGGFV